MSRNEHYRFEEASSGEPRSKRSRGERIVFVLLVLALIAALIGVCVYFTNKTNDLEDENSELKANAATSVPDVQALQTRIDCIPEAEGKSVEATEGLCRDRRCSFQKTGFPGIPDCYFPETLGYSVKDYEETPLGFSLKLEMAGNGGPFGNDWKHVDFDVEMRGENIIRFKFDDPMFERYKVPISLDLPDTKVDNPKFSFRITNNETFAFQIVRVSTGTVLWDTGIGGLILSDQFLQISTQLPSNNVYGFGENRHKSFRHDLQHTTWPMFSRDQAPNWKDSANLYGVHPFYTCLENDGNSHGVFLLNSNAQDYSFTPHPMLTYRTIGGVLDFYMFMGPEPEAVVQQYTGVIGRPYMPPYWSLGFQLCRYGYNSLEKLQEAVNRTKMYNIPHDVQYADIDHMDERMDFTLDNVNFNGLPEYFEKLRDNGMRTIIILDPTLITNETNYEPYDNLTRIQGAIQWPEHFNAREEDRNINNAILGFVWPKGKVVFPDFFKDGTKELWKRLIVKHRKTIPFDAVWIDMNEPANFGTNLERPWNWPVNATPYWSLECPTNNRFEDPPYRTKAAYVFDGDELPFERLSAKTICLTTRQGNNNEYMHYDVHSLYGWSQSPPTLEGAREATNERSLVLTRSTYPSSGKYAGHWLGDNESVWPDLVYSIIGMLEFNLFGIPYVGVDICGFWGNSTAELCKRWMELGAFYPFSRNHNGINNMEQDPGYFGAEVAKASREALEIRYSLLPYLYTLFHNAHVLGDTVVRPLFHEFPQDPVTYVIERQFLWGHGFLVVPILEEGQTQLKYYLPAGSWYNFYNGKSIQGPSNMTEEIDADSKIHLFVRGGTILPRQEPANNTHYSRRNKMKLLVALDGNGEADGELFWDDGNSVDTYETGNYFMAKFKAEKNMIQMSLEHQSYDVNLVLGEICIFGAPAGIQKVSLGNEEITTFSYDKNVPETLVLANLSIPMYREFSIFYMVDMEDDREHLDCYPEVQGGLEQVTKQSCENRGCIYNPGVTQGPVCYINPQNYGYKVVGRCNETDLGFDCLLKHKGRASPYSSQTNPDVENLLFSVQMTDNEIVRIKITDKDDDKRYEVPKQLNLGTVKATDPRYEVKVTSEDPFSFKVIRKSNGMVIWDTGVGGLTYSKQFLQISTRLPSQYIYGFGENVHATFKHDLQYKTWPMWSRDQPVGWGSGLNHYGVHPFYTCMEAGDNGAHSHGVLLLNSNAQDYSFTPLPMLTYRTIGGILDFYMFMGPEPENVIQQYTHAIGRPYMPPYWALGFQLCRYGYNSIENIKAAVNRTLDAGIPLDVQYADIDHMHTQMDFTVDDSNFAGLDNYFKLLQSTGMHIIIILDPTLISNVSDYKPFKRMTETNSNIKWASDESFIPEGSSINNNDLLGYVWPPGKVVFPDFFKNNTQEIWKELIKNHHDKKLTFDGLWIDMNEPANFGTNEERPFNWPEDAKPYWSLNCTFEGNTLEHPPYRTKACYAHDNRDTKRAAMLSDKTICMRAVQGDNSQYKHYDVHSLYGWSQTQPTLQGLRSATGERGIVISRSTFPGSGQYAGHWLGDNDSQWKEMRESIIGIMEFNLFGIPYIGADICGFMQNTTAELCKRWMQLGAFYTFSRNHNGINYMDQDPGIFPPETGVARASKIAMETRYSLLPYLYTLFHHAHVRGNTVIRPLHHQFPDDVTTYSINEQFMWGPALLISPILYEGQSVLEMYFPKGPWYDFYTGKEVPEQGSFLSVPVNADSNIQLHVRAGHILPTQAPATNTKHSRKNPFTLKVALRDSENGGRGHTATGELFWDDGTSIDTYEGGNYYLARFWSGHNTLKMTIEHNNSALVSSLFIEAVEVYGVPENVNYVYFDDTKHSNLTFEKSSKVLKINSLRLPLNEEFTMEWREFRKPTPTEMGRIDCGPDLKVYNDSQLSIKRELCNARGCSFDPIKEMPYLPSCYVNRQDHGYKRMQTSNNTILLTKKSNASIFGKDIKTLEVRVEKRGDSMVRIKIFDPNNERYEAPVPLDLPEEGYNDSTALYDVIISPDNAAEDFYIKIVRKSTNITIWDMSAGPLIFSDQYLQLSTSLASDYFYGLGEHRHFHLKHNMEYKTWPIFTRDAAVNSPDFTNLYGAHPFYMNLEDDKGNANAVLFLNTNAMEVILEPHPRLTYRTIGGILDFYVFLGPEPETVIQQYTQVIGHPVMIPYWSLGFQLCRWGYKDLDDLKGAVERTKAAGIPHDIQYADIDYMDQRTDFTYNTNEFAGLPDYVKELQAGGMHFIIILDPVIISSRANYPPFEEGLKRDVFIKWPANTGPEDSRVNGNNTLLGYSWPPGKVAYPDFLKNETGTYWSDMITDFHNTINFDGLWIDMNEPANFGTNELKPWNWPEGKAPWSLKCTLDNNTYDVPPYKPASVLGDVLSEKTICMIGEQVDGKYKHYDVHSLYGWSQTKPTQVALKKATNKRGVVVSRSTYPSTGRYGAHWLGDNDSFWRNLHDSIIGIIEFNLFGIPYVGADICGFFAESTPEMCQRWMQLGAFYTFSRNHNGLDMKNQDPAVHGKHVAYSSKRAFEIRYSLLPYVYTRFYHVHQNGGTVIRSMMHEFTTDKRMREVDTQFMWGSAFLIAPVLEEGAMEKDVHLPDARWFDYYTGREMARNTIVTVDAPRDFIPLFIRGGFVLPTQEPANNTVHSRVKPLGLIVALDDAGVANGDLFWDDGESIDTIEKKEYFYAVYDVSNGTLKGSVVQQHSNVTSMLSFTKVWVYGVRQKPSSIQVSPARTNLTNLHQYNAVTQMLTLDVNYIPLASNFTITWD